MSRRGYHYHLLSFQGLINYYNFSIINNLEIGTKFGVYMFPGLSRLGFNLEKED
jgi:hypothetical protein